MKIDIPYENYDVSNKANVVWDDGQNVKAKRKYQFYETIVVLADSYGSEPLINKNQHISKFQAAEMKFKKSRGM